MPSRRSFLIPIALTIVFTVVCVRLGIWQLDRLAQRRAFNARLETRLSAPPRAVDSLPADTASGHYSRVRARGVFVYGNEAVLAARSQMGSPGVHVFTPLRLADGTQVMVNRGWVYAPDAMTIDATVWHEHDGDTVTVIGYAETWKERAPRGTADRRGVVRALDSAAVAHIVGGPIRSYYVAQTSDSARGPQRPVRLGEPVLDDGSHKNYAIQWFSFALIALMGGALLVREEYVRRRAAA